MKGKETFDSNRPIIVMVGSATKTEKEKSGAASKEGCEGGKANGSAICSKGENPSSINHSRRPSLVVSENDREALKKLRLTPDSLRYHLNHYYCSSSSLDARRCEVPVSARGSLGRERGFVCERRRARIETRVSSEVIREC
jgi:hypothetical protein